MVGTEPETWRVLVMLSVRLSDCGFLRFMVHGEVHGWYLGENVHSRGGSRL